MLAAAATTATTNDSLLERTPPEGKKDLSPKKRGVRGNNAATTPRRVVLRGRMFGFAQWLDESVTKAVPVLAPNQGFEFRIEIFSNSQNWEEI